ncbi:MAG: patatin-like phospholipase family protein, partial [Candidatus Eremiobacteraeota bacterium]|nr:patatin-like phospholipase family protein [Candidatus Eremiobacteraeota bacterium]
MKQQGHTALVLSGGGARGAYQAGVLRGLIEIGVLKGPECPFSILVGTSAGSLTATMLAANADRFERGLSELLTTWQQLKPSRVF